MAVWGDTRSCSFANAGAVLLSWRPVLRPSVETARSRSFIQARLETAPRAEIYSVQGLSRSPSSSIIPATRSSTVSRSLAIQVKSRKYC